MLTKPKKYECVVFKVKILLTNTQVVQDVYVVFWQIFEEDFYLLQSFGNIVMLSYLLRIALFIYHNKLLSNHVGVF